MESQRLKELFAARAAAEAAGDTGGGNEGNAKNAAFRECSARARSKGNSNNSRASKSLASCMKEKGY